MLASQGLPLYPFHKGIILLHTSQINMGSKVDTNHAMSAHWSIALVCLRLCLTDWMMVAFQNIFHSGMHQNNIFLYFFQIIFDRHKNDIKHKKKIQEIFSF